MSWLDQIFFDSPIILSGCNVMQPAGIPSTFRRNVLSLPSESAKQETTSPTLKMNSVVFSETSVGFYWIAQHYVPADITLHKYRCEKLKSNDLVSFIKKNSGMWFEFFGVMKAEAVTSCGLRTSQHGCVTGEGSYGLSVLSKIFPFEPLTAKRNLSLWRRQLKLGTTLRVLSL
jgi:hypothetical protein